jgi:probable HAF family extracellular repeat protein
MDRLGMRYTGMEEGDGALVPVHELVRADWRAEYPFRIFLILIRERHDGSPKLARNPPTEPEASMHMSLSRLILSAALALPGAAALADPLYAVTLLGGTGSTATGINRWGDVVGNADSGGATHGFAYLSGKYVDLGTLGGTGSNAHGINDDGQIVGGANTASGQFHAYLYAGGSMSDLGTLGGDRSEAFAINNHGTIVGDAASGDPATLGFGQAFSFSGGTMHALGTLPGGLGSNAYAINNTGLVGGASYEGPFTVPEYPFHAVLVNGGGVNKIGASDIGDSAVFGLNDLGQAVGGLPSTELTHASHAFLYDHGALTDLGVLDLTAPDDSIALDINNHGQIVGRAAVTLDPDHYGYHGFLWTGSGLVDLNTLIDPASGWVITDATGINDASQIAATACYGGVTGDCRAVRLDLVSAVPEPGSWAMLGLGLGVVGVLKRRRRAGRTEA